MFYTILAASIGVIIGVVIMAALCAGRDDRTWELPVANQDPTLPSNINENHEKDNV